MDELYPFRHTNTAVSVLCEALEYKRGGGIYQLLSKFLRDLKQLSPLEFFNRLF
jgi:hypothetical protein